MDVYMYQADLWCEDCGRTIREELTKEGKAPEDPEEESTYDSDDFPKGPYPDGGGESDTPAHCGAGEDCINAITLSDGSKVGALLENDLTEEGGRYVVEAVTEAELEWLDSKKKHHASVAIEIWRPFYDYLEYPRVIDEKQFKRDVEEKLMQFADSDVRLDELALTELADDLRSSDEYIEVAEEVDEWPVDLKVSEYMILLDRWLDGLEREGKIRRG